MCGLSGSYSPEGKLDRSLCVDMHDRLYHRGPDETYSLNNQFITAKLGRLGMIGLKNGWQPSEDQSGRFVALTNGEIYNAQALFDELGIEPHNGNKVDVAIISELVARQGIESLKKIDGQFASVIYDSKERSLYLARDRFGICPLFFSNIKGVIHFCSELKSLVLSVPNSWRIDYAAIDQFFALGNIVAPKTLVEDVSAVPPGCAICFDEKGSNTVRYWRYGEFSINKNPVDYDKLRVGLQDSISSRLSSDVEIGAYLSGGFDSTVILMESMCHFKSAMRTFSVTFDDPTLDEGPFQRKVADMVGSQHEEIRCTRSDIGHRFENMVRHCCFPQRETYNVAALMLSERVQEANIKGVVSGEGADELFFGYDSYAFDSALRKPRPSNCFNEQAWGRADFSWEIDEKRVEQRRNNFLSSRAREAIVSQEYWQNRLIPFSENEITEMSSMQLRSIADVYVQLAGHLLGDHGDSMVMANSIEGRYPFLGNSMVSLALQIPDKEKVVNFEGKACLRKTYRSIVPNIVLDRGKHGFTAYDLQTTIGDSQWSKWRELVASVDALNVDCMGSDVEAYQEEKWDFRLGAISLAMIADELSLSS